MSVRYAQLLVSHRGLFVEGLQEQEFQLISAVFPKFKRTSPPFMENSYMLVQSRWERDDEGRYTCEPQPVDQGFPVLNKLAEIGYRVISVKRDKNGDMFYTLEWK